MLSNHDPSILQVMSDQGLKDGRSSDLVRTLVSETPKPGLDLAELSHLI